MKRNNLMLKLLGLLAVLAGVAVVFANPFKQPAPDATGAITLGPGSADSRSGLLLVDAAAENLSAIEITAPGQASFRLSKEADQWLAVQGEQRYKADRERVERLLEDLPGLRAESLVTERDENFRDLGVHEDSAIRVAVFTGSDSPAAELLVGNSAPGQSSTFVRKLDSVEVYKASANIRALVGFSYADYRSKLPWSFDTQLVDKLTVRPVAGTAETYTKQDGVWKTATGANANQNLIVTLLNDWSNAKVSGFADDVTPGQTAYDASIEGADGAGTGGKDAKGGELPPQFKLGLEPNLIAEGPQGRFSLTLGVKEAGLYYLADQDSLAYRIGEYDLRFFRELKYDELKIASSEGAMVDTGMLNGDTQDSAGAADGQ